MIPDTVVICEIYIIVKGEGNIYLKKYELYRVSCMLAKSIIIQERKAGMRGQYLGKEHQGLFSKKVH